MENKNKKNSAVKKVDEIVKSAQVIPEVETPTTETETIKTEVKKARAKKKPTVNKSVDKADNAKKSVRKEVKKKSTANQKKIAREKAAEKRMQLKKEREEKKRALKEEKAAKKAAAKEARQQKFSAEKQARIKKAAAKKQAKKRKAESIKALKIKKREERLARKDRLKNESRAEREARIAAEKQAKIKVKADKAAAKAEFKRAKAERRAENKRIALEKRENAKRYKAEKRAERKENRAARRERSKSEKRKRGIGGWLAAVISLGCTVLILGSLLTLSVFTDYVGAHPANDASATAARNFYDFVGYVDGLETNMAKVFVSSDDNGRQRLLGEIVVQSNLADNSLAQLPIADESKYYTSKYINQVGDYAKYLNNRLIDGQKLTKDEYAELRRLYDINVNLKSALSTLSANIGEDYDFKNLTENNANDVIIAQFNELEKSAVEYPQMIYDGPFSDGLDAVKPKGVSGEEVGKDAVKEEFGRQFAAYKVTKTEVTGVTENTRFACYNVLANTEEGGDVLAQYTVQGGNLLNFTAHKDCGEVKVDEDECESNAVEFIKSLGFKNMKRVWRYTSGGAEYLNFAATIGKTTVYPDMIKVTVCRETGRVTGFDAEEYYLNHTERGEFRAAHTLAEALDKVDAKLDVTYSGKAIVPVGNGKESVAYEFAGTEGGQEYIVFINANTLKEIKIYKVVNTEEGRLLV